MCMKGGGKLAFLLDKYFMQVHKTAILKNKG